MKIVIDIDENLYTRLFDNGVDNYDDAVDIAKAIRKGIPIPEHHGDLIDRDAIEVLRIGNIKREYDKGFDAGVSCMVNRILETPTIIEGSDPE